MSTPSPAARRARVAVATLFFANGAVFVNLVPRYPEVEAELELSNAAFGVDRAYGLGSLALGPLGGVLVSRWGSARVATVTTVAMAANLVLLAVASTWLALAVALFLAGSLDSVADIGANAHGLRVERLYDRSILNSVHGVWSIGAVTGGARGPPPQGSASRSRCTCRSRPLPSSRCPSLRPGTCCTERTTVVRRPRQATTWRGPAPAGRQERGGARLARRHGAGHRGHRRDVGGGVPAGGPGRVPWWAAWPPSSSRRPRRSDGWSETAWSPDWATGLVVRVGSTVAAAAMAAALVVPNPRRNGVGVCGRGTRDRHPDPGPACAPPTPSRACRPASV